MAILRRMRPEGIEFRHGRIHEGMENRFFVDHAGVFAPKVVAIEFEEVGPILFVNGEYNNLDERLYIEGVTVEMEPGGFDETFVSFEPCAPEHRMDTCLGDLLNLTAPTPIEAYDRGLFRTPLFIPDREAMMREAMEGLGESARRMVDKFDRDFGEYSLDGHGIETMEKEFLREREVREIVEQINDQFIWRQGDIRLKVRFIMDDEDNAIEEIPITLNLSHEGIIALKENIDNMAVNFLLHELELPQEVYNTVVFER